jgi:hypothetical protein
MLEIVGGVANIFNTGAGSGAHDSPDVEALSIADPVTKVFS